MSRSEFLSPFNFEFIATQLYIMYIMLCARVYTRLVIAYIMVLYYDGCIYDNIIIIIIYTIDVGYQKGSQTTEQTPHHVIVVSTYIYNTYAHCSTYYSIHRGRGYDLIYIIYYIPIDCVAH